MTLRTDRSEEERPTKVGTVRPCGMDAVELRRAVEEYRRTGNRRIRNRIVEAHLHLVDHHVRVFERRGPTSRDDLRQTALLALVGAVDRFDPEGGASLSTFAARTIDGELKRFLRDRTWLVRPPRSTQERHLDVRRAGEELTQRLGRAPTVRELADDLGRSEDDVILALIAGEARNNESLDQPVRAGEALRRMDAVAVTEEAGYELTESLVGLRRGMSRLDDRQRQILRMRFADEMSQSAISDRVGVSQSYVSRIIQSALTALRTDLE